MCEAPTFMEWSTMVVPTYPEGGSHALQVCQHHHQVVRVGHFVGLAETQGTWCSRLLRPIRLKPSQYNSAQCALLYREGGGRWPVRPRVRGVLRRRIARWGQIQPNPSSRAPPEHVSLRSACASLAPAAPHTCASRPARYPRRLSPAGCSSTLNSNSNRQR